MKLRDTLCASSLCVEKKLAQRRRNHKVTQKLIVLN